MQYDFEVDSTTWAHTQFEYRVVYHLGMMNVRPVWNGIVGRYEYPRDAEIELRASNRQKFQDYLDQLHVAGQYAMEEMEDGTVRIYCNEWIEPAVLKLTCPEDRQFRKPAFIERLNTGLDVVYAYS